MTLVRRMAASAMRRVDAWYSRKHALRAFGSALLLGVARYRGPELKFDDGTLLRDNDAIGRLHLNNANITSLGDGSTQRIGVRFARSMRESLQQLDEATRSDVTLRDVRVFQGITWLAAHGAVAGFVTTPLPRTLRSRLLAVHFRVLSWVFSPARRTRAHGRIEPRLFWLTREALAKNAGKLAKGAGRKPAVEQ